VIHYRGRIHHLFSKPELRDPQKEILRGLYADVPGCEILVDVADDHLRYNTRTRVVSGSMRVLPTGICNQSTKHHAVVPAQYNLTIGCLACVVGNFTVTPTGTLPFTGSGTPLVPMGLVGAGVLLVGVILARVRRATDGLRCR
jgi:hypothetical protein